MATSNELKKILKNMGYSNKAVNEILKWYQNSKFVDGRQ